MGATASRRWNHRRRRRRATIAGELTRVDLTRRSVSVKTDGREPRELEASTGAETRIVSRGRAVRLEDLRPGDRVLVATGDEAGRRLARVVKVVGRVALPRLAVRAATGRFRSAGSGLPRIESTLSTDQGEATCLSGSSWRSRWPPSRWRRRPPAPRSSTRKRRSGSTRSGRSCSPTRRRRSATSRTRRDRVEFQKIFWARRDPDLDTPDNEFQATYNADARRGGPPVQGRRAERLRHRLRARVSPARQARRDEAGQAVAADAPSLRPPEVWTYRDRPGQTFAGGQVQIAFEKDCQLPQGARLGEQLNKVAESRIVHPNLAYPKGAGRQARQARRPAAQAEPGPGAAQGAAPGLPAHHAALDDAAQPGRRHLRRRPHARRPACPATRARRPQPVNVVVQAVDAQGKTSAQKEREVNGEFAEDGSVIASYGMTLRPGKYTLNVAMLDPKTGKGSVGHRPGRRPRPHRGRAGGHAPGAPAGHPGGRRDSGSRRIRWPTSSSAPTAWSRRSTTCSRSRAR